MALSGYGVYAEVTFAASAVDEAIPFLTVYLSDLPTAWHDAMANAGDTDGRTIRVTKSDGTTECAVYVPPGSVNTSTDTGALFFRATDLSAVLDTTYMIWVGNAASEMYLSTDTYGRNAVFTGYAGVYLPGMTTDDLTGAGRNLTAVNSPGTAAGLEGITAATYATNKYHHYSNASQAVSDWPTTLESFGYTTSTTLDQSFISLCSSSDNNPHAGLTATSSNKASAYFRGNPTSSASQPASAGSLTTSTYYYLAGSRDANSGTSRLYVNGTASTTNTTAIVAPTFNRLAIGAWARTSVIWPLSGNVAVALLSSSVRSADYITTMNKNWLGTLYTAGSVQYVAGTTGKLKLQTAATLSVSEDLSDWADASYAISVAADAATAPIDDVTHIDTEYLKLTNIAYNFAIPSGKSNYAATFYVTRSRQSGGGLEVNDRSFRYVNESGSYAGDDMADLSTVWPTTAAVKEYDVAGTTLSDSSFNSSTGIAIQATAFDSSGSVEARVRFVCVEITWDESAPSTDYGNFFEAYAAFGNVT